jgi:hypothetical protein
MTDLKQLSDEELFSLFINRLNVNDFIGSVEYETELLRRISEGSKAIEEAENLKCCGNCINYYREGYKVGDCSPKMKSRCSLWQSDEKTRKERESE